MKKKITDKALILKKWGQEVSTGKPNPGLMGHQIILEGILEDFNWSDEEIFELLKGKKFRLLEAPEDKKIKWKDEDGESRETSLDTIKQYKYDDDYDKNKNKQLAVKAAGLDDKDSEDDKEDPGQLKGKDDFERKLGDDEPEGDETKDDDLKDDQKRIPVEPEKKSNIKKDEKGRLISIDGKDKTLKETDTGNSETYTEELGSPTDEEFDRKIKDKNKIGHPNKPVPNPKTDLDNDPEMKKLLKALGSPPYRFPKKYLKLISRMMNSHGSGAVTKLTSYIEGGGAGQINSQAGELLTVIGSSLPPEEREEFFKLIEKKLDAQMDPDADPPTAPTQDEWDNVVNASPAKARKEALKELQEKYPHLKINEAGIRKRLEEEPPKGPNATQTNWKVQNNLIVNHGWLNAARKNCEAIDKYIKKNYPGCEVEASAWDTKEDFESLGNSDYKKNKGHSSDQYLKINCGDEGSFLVEASLKKDGKIRLSNSSPSKLFDYTNLTDDEISEFSKNADLPDTPMQDADGDGKITTKDVSEAEFAKRQNERYLNAVKDKIDDICKALEDGTVNFKVDDLGDLTIDGKCNRERVQQLLDGQGNARKRNKLFRDFLNLSEEGQQVVQKNKEDSDRMVVNIVNAMSYDPLKSKMLDGIREALPLKSLFNGEEMMALDNISFDKDTMRNCFGVDSWDELQENLIIDNSNPKKPFIIYELRNKKGEVVKSFKIAKISCRQDGDGYGNIRLDLDLEKEFEDAVRKCDEEVHGKSE